MKRHRKYKEARRLAVDRVSGATPMSDLFDAGFDFAMGLTKPIFDDTFKLGELRSHKGRMYKVVEYTSCGSCDLCVGYSCAVWRGLGGGNCPDGLMFKKV